MRFSSIVRFVVASLPAAVLASACATSTPIREPGTGGDGIGGSGGEPAGACVLHECNSDADCAGCASDRTACQLTDHRCVACGEGLWCAPGEVCSPYGDCVPEGASCPMDANGAPTIACGSSADCVACDPLHQVCDPVTARCTACNAGDTSACDVNDVCVEGACAPRCPATCATDNDCGQCGAGGHELHACNAGQCAACSDTYACPAGSTCTAEGTCVAKCGQDGAGSCFDDSDCTACGEGATTCQKSLGHCG